MAASLGTGYPTSSLVYHRMNFEDVDLIISPKAQMTPPGRLAYVVKKLKDIVKEVKGWLAG